MKTKKMIQRLSLFLLALVLTMPTWAQGGSGKESETITIASKEDWKAFCNRVNSGQTTLNAKLTKDVDLGSDIVMAGTEDLNSPSYNAFFYYTGTFDGQGHTLSFNWNAGEDNQIAPFWCVKDATIKNLRTQGKITTKGYGLSGMVYIALGTTTITGCISDVDITGGDGGWDDSRAAGMVQAVADGASVQITDCLVKGSITDNADEDDRTMAGFVLSNNGTYTLTRCLYVGTNNATNNGLCYTFGTEKGISATFTDCYYLNACGKAQGDKITEEQLKNGYVAYKLQKGIESQVWGQTLGTDNEPQLTADATKRVYEVKFVYNGEVKATRYANRGGNVGTLPTPQEILGTAYNAANSYRLVFAEGFYAEYPIYADRTVAVDVIVNNMCEIATKEDWKKFGDFVRSGEGNLNARLTADIDLGGDILKIGSESTSYSGTFDGQGHTITVDWNGNGGDYFALFPFVTDATIKNLRVTGKMTTDVPMGVFSYLAGGTTTYEHCVSDVRITSGDENSSYSAAGMVHAAYNEGKITFKDCIVAGDLNGTTDNSKQNMGGFVCSQADDATCTFDNCLYTGTNNSKGGYAFAPNPTLNNCYYLNPCGEAQGTQVTAERLKSGYVAHKLQGTREETVWGQVLGTDTIPQPTADAAKRVRKVDFTYKNDVKATRYANDGKSIHGGMPTFTAKDLLGTGYNPHHYYAIAFEGGFNASTPVNADRKVDITLAEKDCYEIATKDDWKVFCALVAGGQTGINAKMTADVDLGTDIAMVGTTNNLYGGTFDGQNHTLTVNWDAGSANDVAPFRRVSGATIKNLRTEGAIRSDSYYLGGLIDEAIGENTVTGCVSNVNLTTSYDYSSCDAAGLICYIYTTGRVTISDCLVKGSINATGKKGRRGMGGFVYVQNGTLVMNNCLYAGTNNASGGYTFASDSDDEATTTLNNCYYLNPCGKAQGERIVEKQLKSGEVTKKLQGDRTDKCYWAQQLGGMPDFYNAADKSKANYVYYDAAKKGWVCDDFRLTDGQPLPIGLDFTAATVTYERNFNGTQNATLCLPYDLYAQGFKAYTLSGGNKNEVHFKETKDKLTAYTPYYITANGMPQLGGRNIEVKAYKADKMTTPAAGYKFTGTVAGVSNATAAAANAYILQDDGKFHKVTTTNSAATIPAYRAYIICPPQASGAKQLSVVLDGETTGIGDVTNEATDGKNGPVYDLQGRRVADRLDDARHRLPAGIYIVGGRKVVVK